MSSSTLEQARPRRDPVWRALAFSYAWNVYFVLFALIYLLLGFYQHRIAFPSFLFFYWLVIGLLNVFPFLGIGLNVRLWHEALGRRVKALMDTEGLVAREYEQPRTNEEALPQSATFALQPSSLALGVFIVAYLAICAFILVLIFAHTGMSWSDIAQVLGTIIGLVVFFTLLIYFGSIYMRQQSIQVTEEGVTTRFWGQKRTLRWEDARTFATYRVQGVKLVTTQVTSNIGNIYELASEQIVVRWASLPAFPGSWLLASRSSFEEKDWNKLVSCLNQVVAARTLLPLLDLSASQQKVAPQAPVNPEDDVLPQPAYKVLRQQGKGVALGVFFLLLLGSALISYSSYEIHVRGATSTGLLLLTLGILIALLPLLFGALLMVARGPVRRLEEQRREALRDPQSFLAPEQPEADSQALPLPLTISLPGPSRWVIALYMLGIAVILWLPCAFWVFSLSWWFALGSTLLFLLAMAPFLSLFVYWQRHVDETRLELTAEGIKTRTAGRENYLRWQDIRLFTLRRAIWSWEERGGTTYQLLGKQKEVTLIWRRSRRKKIRTEPPLSQEAYDRLMEDVLRVVAGRTGLPLVELKPRA